MPCKASATTSAMLPKCRSLAGCSGRRRLVSVAGFSLLVLPLLAGGCGGGSLIELNGSGQFQQQVVQAKKPVLVHFFKVGCTRCGLLESAMDQLVNDYRGRVVFAKYYLKDFFWVVTNKELQSKYKIDGYPTVSLFVNGQERKRWIMYYDISSYRKALDEALGSPMKRATAAPPVVPPSPPANSVVPLSAPANCGCSWRPEPSRTSRPRFKSACGNPWGGGIVAGHRT